jgi:hypothetical protein
VPYNDWHRKARGHNRAVRMADVPRVMTGNLEYHGVPALKAALAQS